MQKFLSSTIQVAAALIPLAGCFFGLPTLAEKGELVLLAQNAAQKKPAQNSARKKPAQNAAKKKPAANAWNRKTQKFIKEFNKQANQVQDPIVKGTLLKKAKSKGGQQELIQLAKSNCAFVRAGRVMSELNQKRAAMLTQEDAATQTILTSQYFIVNKLSGNNFCPDLAHLMKL